MDLGIKLEESDCVGNRCAILFDSFGDLILCHSELILKAGEGPGLVNGVEILTLEIFDEGKLEMLGVIVRRRFLDDHGDLGPTESFDGTESPLPRDEEVASLPHRGHDDRLKEAMLGY